MILCSVEARAAKDLMVVGFWAWPPWRLLCEMRRCRSTTCLNRRRGPTGGLVPPGCDRGPGAWPPSPTCVPPLASVCHRLLELPRRPGTHGPARRSLHATTVDTTPRLSLHAPARFERRYPPLEIQLQRHWLGDAVVRACQFRGYLGRGRRNGAMCSVQCADRSRSRMTSAGSCVSSPRNFTRMSSSSFTMPMSVIGPTLNGGGGSPGLMSIGTCGN